MKNKTLKKLSFVILGLIIVGLVFIASFFMSSYSPNSIAMDNLEDSQLVDVTVDDFITFTPDKINSLNIIISFLLNDIFLQRNLLIYLK